MSIRIPIIFISFVFLLLCQLAMSCTIFIASSGKHVLVGNNEDYKPGTETFLWFRPGGEGRIGYVFWGFEEKYPEGGLNEKGLFFDAAALSKPIPIVKHSGRIDFEGYLVEPLFKQCAQLDEAVHVIEKYNLLWQERAQIFLADRTGDYAIVHANYIIRKKDQKDFVLTNYNLSGPQSSDTVCWRRRTAQGMLSSGKKPSVKLVSSILCATAQADWGNATLYSHEIDLTDGRVTLYQIRNFDQPFTFRLSDELTKGSRNIEMKTLFPPTASALVAEMGMDAAIQQIRSTKKVNPIELLGMGYSLLNQKHPDDAIRIFNLACDIFPSSKTYSDLANANGFIGNLPVANAMYAKAFQADPDNYCANLMHLTLQAVLQ